MADRASRASCAFCGGKHQGAARDKCRLKVARKLAAEAETWDGFLAEIESRIKTDAGEGSMDSEDE